MIITNDVKPGQPSQVNHPNHYNQGNIECIDALDDIGLGRDFCIGSALKYLWRYKDKENPVQDLEKAVWYINHVIEGIKKGDYKV